METVTFTTTFTGNPKPDISWYHNNKLIRQHASYQMRVRNDKAMLTVVQARPEMKGEYTCRAVNSEGEIFSKATLEVTELTFEEKLKIDDERYAAVHIQHAAEQMKEKERERAIKLRKEHHEAMERLKVEKQERSVQLEKELEEAKKKAWKPLVEEKKTKVFTSAKERCVAEVYTNWKAPVTLEERYPAIQPNEFAPNQIPGVKCFVKVSETSIKGEEVVKDIAPQFFEEKEVIQELSQIHTMLKSNVKVNEIWAKFRAGEFKTLLQPKIQPALVKICEHIGHQRNVSIVLAQETREQAKKHPVGLKAFLRMVKHAKNIKPDTLFKEIVPREMGLFSSTTQELTKVSQMINQGVETEEIIAFCEAGKLPALKKPESQQPLINIVEKHGHSVMVAQVLVEEAYREAKYEKVTTEEATEVIHEEEEKKTIKVSKVKSELCVPGFKSLIHLATDNQIDLETVELRPVEKAAFAKDIAKLSFHLKKGVQVNELMTMIKENEFVSLKQPQNQAKLLEVADRLGHATVHKVLVQEAADRCDDKIGLKSVIRTIQRGKESMEQAIMDTAREFGPSSEPVKEMAAVGYLLQEGVKCDEVLTLVESGLLPSLKMPQAQVPFTSMVIDKGHIGSICEILVEECVREVPRPKTKAEAARMTEVKEMLKKAKAETVDVKTFTSEMVPGVKAYVRMAQEESVNIEEVVQKAKLEPKMKEEMAKIGMMVKHGVMTQDVLTLMETGEFPQLMREEAQAELMTVVEDFGFRAIINQVVLEQVQQAMQKTGKALGTKSFMRMMEKAKVNVEEILTEKFPKELVTDLQEPVSKEMAKVSVMLKEGVQTQEIMSMIEAGELPSLKLPDAQMPLVNMVGQEGHTALVCQVLIEDSVSNIVQELPKVDKATISSVETLESATETQVEVKVLEIPPPLSVKPGDQLRATATYIADNTQENAMHLVEGEKVYVQEMTNSDWWFVKKHLTLEEGYVPAKLLAEEVSYTHYVEKKIEEKANKLPVFDKLKKGQKSELPKMVTKLEPVTVVDGQEAQFVCKIKGTPRPTVTWFRQTAIIKPSEEFQVFYSDDNTATLVVKEVFPEDAGLFTCVAKNQAGYITSSAELVVEGPISDHGSDSMIASRRSLSRESSVCDIMEGIPPTFANKPTVKTVEEGTQLELDVRLVAIPEPEIIWRKDGQVVRESPRIRLVKQKDVHAYRSIIIIKGAKKEDEGLYEITVKNREGEAKNHITLRVTAPEVPEFEDRYPDQTVESEGTIRLVAKIHGIPSPDVTWSRNGKKLKEGKNVVMTYQDELAVLEIRNVQPKEDSGKYVCTATNKVGKASHTANITVGAEFVTFKRGLESCIVDEGSEVVLECRTSKEKPCKWFKGKTEIKKNETFEIEQDGLTHRLIIHSATLNDTGKYKCTFDDQTTFCNLTVRGLDDFVERVQDVEVQEREEAILLVEVTSEKATVTWHKDGEEITEQHKRFTLVTEGKVRKLVIKEATLSDEGEYTCALGDHECTAELTVRELPAEIVRKMKDQVVSKGNRATMEVELTKGDAVITWFKEEKEIRFSDHYQLSIDGKVQRLMVYNCQLEDSGTYRAVVGKSECSATLKVELQVEGDFSKGLPGQMDVNYKSDITFTVEITKDSEVKWFKGTEELKPSDKYIIKKEGKKRILIVKNCTQSDAAEYSCVLGNLKTSCKLNVIIMETAPKIDKEYQKVEVVVTKGTDVTLKVPYTGTPIPTATWSHKGQPLDKDGTRKMLPTINETEAYITLKTVEEADCGEYRLKLSNDCGTVHAEFIVKLLGKWLRILCM